MRYSTLILAGGVADPQFTKFGKAVNKAFLSLGKQYMVEYVVDALLKSEVVERVFLVCPNTPLSPNLIKLLSGIIPDGNSLFESLYRGIMGMSNPTERILISSADLPLITPKAINNFVSRAEEFEADLYYPFVEKRDSEKSFPGIPHTWVPLKEGIFCGGGLILMNPERLKNILMLAKKVTSYRKNPWKLVTLFGFKNILKYVFRMLSVEDLEKKGSLLLGFPAKGIRSFDPEIAFNVDDGEGFIRAAQALGVSLPHLA